MNVICVTERLASWNGPRRGCDLRHGSICIANATYIANLTCVTE